MTKYWKISFETREHNIVTIFSHYQADDIIVFYNIFGIEFAKVSIFNPDLEFVNDLKLRSSMKRLIMKHSVPKYNYHFDDDDSLEIVQMTKDDIIVCGLIP